MSATGTWNAHIVSPMGRNPVLFELIETDGVVTGTATAEGETVPIIDGIAEGDDLSWILTITRPMKMSFTMKLHVEGDSWTGTAKARIFPAAKVTGERAAQASS
jgi:hypothetical protein